MLNRLGLCSYTPRTTVHLQRGNRDRALVGASDRRSCFWCNDRNTQHVASISGLLLDRP